MKQLLIILSALLLGLQLNAQLVYNEDKKIVPFSQVEKYKKIIEAHEVETFTIPRLNNDSLCMKYNGKYRYELGNEFVGSMVYDNNPINLKKKGTKIELPHGTLWQYSIQGRSAKGILVSFYCEGIPKGAYLAVIQTDSMHYMRQEPDVYSAPSYAERKPANVIMESTAGRGMMIEYYEPHDNTHKEEIIIRHISYGFVGFGINPYVENRNNLKSGVWGDSEHVQCQKDLVCPEFSGWANEAKAVLLIRSISKIDHDGDGVIDHRTIRNATGFFLNKVNDYDTGDSPLLITAGHYYAYEKDDETIVDLLSVAAEHQLSIVAHYKNRLCGIDHLDNYGVHIGGGFNRITLGSGYDKSPEMTGYSASDDYAILQANWDVGKLSQYNIEYAGWNKNYNLASSSNTGYTCLHHPNGDVLKANRDNDKAYNAGGSDFNLYYDIGLTEPGSSGAPIFNASKKIVGWNCAGASVNDCDDVGNNSIENLTIMGSLANIYNDLSFILDPNSVGETESSNPPPPDPADLPSHCRNCMQDNDETGLDCGGSCLPCGLQDVKSIKTDLELLGNVKSRYEIFAEPDPGTLLCLKSGNSSLEAGLNVYLNGGFEIQKGATFYAGIDAELMSEAERGCQNPCIFTANVFTPDGDGANDYWGFRQAFITNYSIEIYTAAWQQKIYFSYNQAVHSNGFIFAWDGSGANSNGVYKVIIEYTDCNGNQHSEYEDVHIFGLKSADVEPPNKTVNEITDVTEIDTAEQLIQVYPNPFSDKVSISYSGDIFPLRYRISDANGKEILNSQLEDSNKEVDLSGLSPGIYIIHAKAGDCNLIQKLIKQ